MDVNPPYGPYSGDDSRYAIPYVLRCIGILSSETAGTIYPDEGTEDREAYHNADSSEIPGA